MRRCLGVKESRVQLQSLPSSTQAFFAFDFIPQPLPSLFCRLYLRPALLLVGPLSVKLS